MNWTATGSLWSGRDALEDLVADVSSVAALDTGPANVPRPARRAWMSSLASASSVASPAIWPASAEDRTRGDTHLLTATTAVDHHLHPAMADVAVLLLLTDVTPTNMDIVDVATRDLLTVDMVDPADTASARLTTQAADTVDALLPLTTAMADVDVPQAPTGKLYFFFCCCCLIYLCFVVLLWLPCRGECLLFSFICPCSTFSCPLLSFVLLCLFFCKNQYFLSSDMTKGGTFSLEGYYLSCGRSVAVPIQICGNEGLNIGNTGEAIIME